MSSDLLLTEGVAGYIIAVNREFQGRGEEIVRAFPPEMVSEFLKRFCGGNA